MYPDCSLTLFPFPPGQKRLHFLDFWAVRCGCSSILANGLWVKVMYFTFEPGHKNLPHTKILLFLSSYATAYRGFWITRQKSEILSHHLKNCSLIKNILFGLHMSKGIKNYFVKPWDFKAHLLQQCHSNQYKKMAQKWMAQGCLGGSVSWTLDFGSGCRLAVFELKPHTGLNAVSA